MSGLKLVVGLLVCVLLESAIDTEVGSNNYIVGRTRCQPTPIPVTCVLTGFV